MAVQETGAALAALAALVGGVAGVSAGGRWARATVDVPSPAWVRAVSAARDELHCDFFDWLSAVDLSSAGADGGGNGDGGGNDLMVVVHVWSTTGRYGLILRTTVPAVAPVLDSIVDIYAGAGWSERETHEMFGIDFRGHPDLAPLLLPAEFEGNPLRKDFVLASRVAKPWPGAVEPGEPAEPNARRRAPLRPPGVPEPARWGPTAGSGATAQPGPGATAQPGPTAGTGAPAESAP